MTSTTLPFSRGTLVIPKVCYLGCQPVLMMEADFWISPRPINFSWECYVGNLIVAIMRKIVFWFCIVACSMCTHIAQSLCYVCVDTHTHTHTHSFCYCEVQNSFLVYVAHKLSKWSRFAEAVAESLLPHFYGPLERRQISARPRSRPADLVHRLRLHTSNSHASFHTVLLVHLLTLYGHITTAE